MNNEVTYKGFIGSVNYSAEDHIFLGKIEGINDLVTFEGTSVNELENAFREMVNLHIEDCKREEKPLENRTKAVSIYESVRNCTKKQFKPPHPGV